MGLQSPNAPISKHMLVRAPRTIPPGVQNLNQIRRPLGPTAFWSDLDARSLAGPSQGLITTAETYLRNNPVQPIFVAPFDVLGNATDDFDTLRRTLGSDGISAAIVVVRAMPLSTALRNVSLSQ